MRGGKGAGVQGAIRKRLVVAVSTASTAVQSVTSILTCFILPATIATVCLCRAVVFGAVVLGFPAVSAVDLTGL